MQRTPRILWADDEIDLLKPHLLFLEGKGFHVTAVNSGVEALEKLGVEVYDLVSDGHAHALRALGSGENSEGQILDGKVRISRNRYPRSEFVHARKVRPATP